MSRSLQPSGSGIVYLVGSGPGDPGLITVRAAELLRTCDVVVYDALANPVLLNDLRSDCQQIYVGKRAAHHSMTQQQINAVLVEQGLAGMRVVRLKGGDPFVFGRGGEECEALLAAGVKFEVVPGITAAIAAAAYAGIPITHRDFNSSFTLVTGHERDDALRDPQAQLRTPGSGGGTDAIDYAVLAKLPCIAFYMGVKSLSRISSRLIENGMSSDTPVAVIQWGTHPTQRTVTGTLQTIAKVVEDAGIAAPAITLVGKVVELRQNLSWFESRPLFGKTVLVTRTRDQASELSSRLTELGARVIEAPTIDIVPAENQAEVEQAIADAKSFDWIVFTSANGVRKTRELLDRLGLDVRALGQAKIAAVGESTAAAVREALSLRPALIPKRELADALADELLSQNEIDGKKFLLLRADIARPTLAQRLRDGNANQVKDVAIYQTRIADRLPDNALAALDSGAVDIVTFTSASTATNLAALLGDDYRTRLGKSRCVSIGPLTSQAITSLGLTVAAEAARPDLDSMIDCMLATALDSTK